MHIAIHVSDADLTGAVNSYVERRLRFALSRFGARVGHVSVRMSADGPASSRCRIEAELLPFGHVAVEEIDSDLFAAIDQAQEESAGCSAENWSEPAKVEQAANRFELRLSLRPQWSFEE